MTERVKPEACATLTEVRHGIDVVDQMIVAMLGERFSYIEAAARIKNRREAVRDEARKSQVIEQARRVAGRVGAPDDFIAQFYELLVETSIEHEFACFDRAKAVNE